MIPLCSMEGPRVRMSYRKAAPPVRPVVNAKGVRMLVPTGTHRSYRPDRVPPLKHLDHLVLMAEINIKASSGIRVES